MDDEHLRGLNMGGLSPANLVGSNSPLSSFWEATIICSKMARVGERQVLHVHEALPVHRGDSTEGPVAKVATPPPTMVVQSAKLTWGVGVLVDMVTSDRDDWGYRGG